MVVLVAVFAVILMGAYPASLVAIDLGGNPNGAAGSPMSCNGTTVGSRLIAENVSSPKFFQPRNATATASGADPDITPAEAYDQVARVANATGISASSLDYLIQQNINNDAAGSWYLSPAYVDVNSLNLDLVQLYPAEYAGFCAG